MKVCIIQPAYCTDYMRSDDFFSYEMDFLESCTPDLDLIVMPEYCDVPCFTDTKEKFINSIQKYNSMLIQKACDTALRCKAIVFINAISQSNAGLRNTTYAIDREGKIVGHYYKQHLTPNEVAERNLDNSYTLTFDSPTVIEIEGIRYGFLTCYDFYFYEAFAQIAREKIDIIIGCSHQRSDSHSALEMMTRFCAYNCNAYVLRSSVSMGEDKIIGGASMIVAPDATVLVHMKSKVGMATAEIDPTKKYYKPAGFGNPNSAHYEYIEKGRRPWKYRAAGSAIVPNDIEMPYPRICAHRGFNTIAPENSMAAFGAAVAMGAEEIEFDLWVTKDGEIVVSHDENMERISNGNGIITEMSYTELLKFDVGYKFSEHFSGLHILKFEDVLRKFACHVIMNIHIKTDPEGPDYNAEHLRKIVNLIYKYDCVNYVYFMSTEPVLRIALEIAPEIRRCCGAGRRPWDIVERAIAYKCHKVQLFKPYFNQEMIDKAQKNRIRCNVFYADDPDEANKYLKMGVDTILTNDYGRVSQAIKQEKIN